MVNASLRRYWSRRSPSAARCSTTFSPPFRKLDRWTARPVPENSAARMCSISSSGTRSTGSLEFKNSHRLDLFAFLGFKGVNYELPRANSAIAQTVLRSTNVLSTTGTTIPGRSMAAGPRTAPSPTEPRSLPYYLGRYFGFILETTSPQNGATPKVSLRRESVDRCKVGASWREVGSRFFDRTRRFGFSRIESSLSRNRAARS